MTRLRRDVQARLAKTAAIHPALLRAGRLAGPDPGRRAGNVVIHGLTRCESRPAVTAAPETGFITGEQPQRAPGIPCGASGGAGAGVGSAAPALSSASGRREGSKTMATITPRPRIAAAMAKAVV